MLDPFQRTERRSILNRLSRYLPGLRGRELYNKGLILLGAVCQEPRKETGTTGGLLPGRPLCHELCVHCPRKQIPSLSNKGEHVLKQSRILNIIHSFSHSQLYATVDRSHAIDFLHHYIYIWYNEPANHRNAKPFRLRRDLLVNFSKFSNQLWILRKNFTDV